jgi:hypothetical protein
VGVKPTLRDGPRSLTSRIETAVARIRRPRLPYGLPKRRIYRVWVNPSQERRDCEPRITRWAVAIPTAYASCGDFELARQLKIGHLQTASCQANQICHGSHMSVIGAMSATPVALSRLPTSRPGGNVATIISCRTVPSHSLAHSNRRRSTWQLSFVYPSIANRQEPLQRDAQLLTAQVEGLATAARLMGDCRSSSFQNDLQAGS